MRSTTLNGPDVRATGHPLPRRLAPASGALFPLGIVLGDDVINRAGEPPVPMDRPDDSLVVVKRYLANAAEAAANGNYWIGRGIGLLALVALLVFTVYVAREIRIREGHSGMLAGLSQAAGLIAVALGLVSGTAQFAAVSRASEGIDLEVARALLDVSGLTFVLMWLPIAAFMASVAMAGNRHALLPRWLTITTTVLACALFGGLAVMPATGGGFIAIILGFLWFIAMGVHLARRAT